MRGTPLDERFAPPQAYVEDIAPTDFSMQLAPRMRRLGAALVDFAVIAALLWVASRLTPWNPWGPRTQIDWFGTQFANTVGGFVLFLLAQGWLLATRGQTIGKVLLKIRIARPDGTLPSVTRLLGLRYGVGYLINIFVGLGMIWGVLDTVFIFRASRRCLHDLIADTVVLNA